MHIDLFDFYLPQDRIAQTAITNRDESKLMVVSKKEKLISHKKLVISK